MSITRRIKKMEKEAVIKNTVFIWVNIDETQGEALKRSGREIKENDKVYYVSWEA